LHFNFAPRQVLCSSLRVLGFNPIGDLLHLKWQNDEERTIGVKSKLMSVLISDEILQAAQISEQELQREIAILLYQQGKLGVGKARELAGMPLIAFHQELSQRGIAVQDNEAGFLAEVEQLKTLGDL
jgi:predicted HTH domain antitoxin